MKKIYVKHILDAESNFSEVAIMGWIKKRRKMGKIIFIDLVDSTGCIQLVIEKNNLSKEEFRKAAKLSLESAVSITGEVRKNKKNESREIIVKSFTMLAEDTLNLFPQPRSDFDIHDPSFTKQMLDYRHIYLRNPKIMGILRFRSKLMQITRDWFNDNDFLEFDAPILTPTPLYDGSTAMSIDVHGEGVFLTQCAGFYLEAASQAFERVFNMGPSFRGEESRSKRHLMEYWHIKAEMAFGNREDIINLVENVIAYITNRCQAECQKELATLNTELCIDGLKSPFPRISYEESIQILKTRGFNVEFGEGLSTAEEEELSKLFDSPFWIVGIPRTVEPFPYVIDPDDRRITMVADLIASNGCGELLGVAEKIHDPQMLTERLSDKGKNDDPKYQFVKDVHNAACVPHIAFGMGLERLIRWLLKIEHVRDTIPFPRVVRRRVYP